MREKIDRLEWQNILLEIERQGREKNIGSGKERERKKETDRGRGTETDMKMVSDRQRY